MAKRVEVLFTKEARTQIKEAVAARKDGYQLPEDFDTVGQGSEDVFDTYVEGSFVVVVCHTDTTYIYPSHSISRVKATGK